VRIDLRSRSESSRGYSLLYTYLTRRQRYTKQIKVPGILDKRLAMSPSVCSVEKRVLKMISLLLFATTYQIEGFRSTTPVRNFRSTSLSMSEDKKLLEDMRKSLGDYDDAFADAEKETKQLMQGLRDLDRDPNMKANNKFMEWLAANGVWIKAESAWGRAPHPLVISSNTEDDGESCGRGLLARESMTEGDLMMTIPLDLCLTRAVSQVRYYVSSILEI
jgi:hypothetical protein